MQPILSSPIILNPDRIITVFHVWENRTKHMWHTNLSTNCSERHV